MGRGLLLILSGLMWVLVTGCSKMAVGLAGMHPYDHQVTWAKKDRLAKRMDIAPEENLVLSRRYAARIEDRKKYQPEKHTKTFYQPLQLRWYSAGGRTQWVVPNCDIGGFPNLQWRRVGLPDTLYATLQARSYADSAWTIQDDLGYMVSRSTGFPLEMHEAPEGRLLVYWTYFMGRQSLRLARHVEKWRKRSGQLVQVHYVNADSLMMGWDKPE